MDGFTVLRNRQSSSLYFLRSDFVFIFLAPVFQNMFLYAGETNVKDAEDVKDAEELRRRRKGGVE